MFKKKHDIFFVFILLFFNSFSQKQINILQSKFLQNIKINNTEYDMFCGDVIAQFKKHKLYCDTIYISKDGKYVKVNSIKSSIITDNKGSKIESKKIEFLKNDTLINFSQEVVFTKNKNKIITDHLSYNPDKKIVYYNNGGKLTDNENTIISKIGKFHSKDEFGQFSENVNMKTSKYIIESDNLDIDNKNEIIFLNSRSKISSDNMLIMGNLGVYDKKEENLSVWGNGFIKTEQRVINCDSIFYNSDKKTSLFGNIEIKHENNIQIFCETFNEFNGTSEFTGEPKIKFKSENSSEVIVEGEIMKLNDNDSLLYIINKTYIISDSIQGKCKNSIFNFKAETICLMEKPVLWTKKSQISGDTIFLFTKNETLDSIYIPNKSFITSKTIDNYFDQIKGKKLFGNFKEGNLHKITLLGNTELKYFETDLNERISGVNDILCSSISINFKDNEIKNISFLSLPKAIYTPKSLINNESLILDGFINRFDEKRF